MCSNFDWLKKRRSKNSCWDFVLRSRGVQIKKPERRFFSSLVPSFFIVNLSKKKKKKSPKIPVDISVPFSIHYRLRLRVRNFLVMDKVLQNHLTFLKQKSRLKWNYIFSLLTQLTPSLNVFKINISKDFNWNLDHDFYIFAIYYIFTRIKPR